MLDHSILPGIAVNAEWLKLMANAAKLALTATGPVVGAVEDFPAIGTPGRKAAKLQRMKRALKGQHTRVGRAA